MRKRDSVQWPKHKILQKTWKQSACKWADFPFIVVFGLDIYASDAETGFVGFSRGVRSARPDSYSSPCLTPELNILRGHAVRSHYYHLKSDSRALTRMEKKAFFPLRSFATEYVWGRFAVSVRLCIYFSGSIKQTAVVPVSHLLCISSNALTQSVSLIKDDLRNVNSKVFFFTSIRCSFCGGFLAVFLFGFFINQLDVMRWCVVAAPD